MPPWLFRTTRAHQEMPERVRYPLSAHMVARGDVYSYTSPDVHQYLMFPAGYLGRSTPVCACELATFPDRVALLRERSQSLLSILRIQHLPVGLDRAGT